MNDYNPKERPKLIKILVMALKDMSENKNRLTSEEMQNALLSLQLKASDKQQKMVSENLRAATEFLGKNKKIDGMESTASGLQYLVEKKEPALAYHSRYS